MKAFILDLLFSIRYRGSRAYLYKQYDFMILVYLFVCVAMCQGDEFIYSVHSRCQCAFSMF
jgi:hypothetical protein